MSRFLPVVFAAVLLISCAVCTPLAGESSAMPTTTANCEVQLELAK